MNKKVIKKISESLGDFLFLWVESPQSCLLESTNYLSSKPYILSEKSREVSNKHSEKV
jgi:hypothetical protein